MKNTEKLTEEIRHIELADENDFQNKFLNAMELKEWYFSSTRINKTKYSDRISECRSRINIK